MLFYEFIEGRRRETMLVFCCFGPARRQMQQWSFALYVCLPVPFRGMWLSHSGPNWWSQHRAPSEKENFSSSAVLSQQLLCLLSPNILHGEERSECQAGLLFWIPDILSSFLRVFSSLGLFSLLNLQDWIIWGGKNHLRELLPSASVRLTCFKG